VFHAADRRANPDHRLQARTFDPRALDHDVHLDVGADGRQVEHIDAERHSLKNFLGSALAEAATTRHTDNRVFNEGLLCARATGTSRKAGSSGVRSDPVALDGWHFRE
jgi:hypothetical protein